MRSPPNDNDDIARTHDLFEGLGLLVGGPLTVYAATRTKPLRRRVKSVLMVTGIATMAVDGYLLYRRHVK